MLQDYTDCVELNEFIKALYLAFIKDFDKNAWNVKSIKVYGVDVIEVFNSLTGDVASICYEESRRWIYITTASLNRVPKIDISRLYQNGPEHTGILNDNTDAIKFCMKFFNTSHSPIIRTCWEFYEGQKPEELKRDDIYLTLVNRKEIVSSQKGKYLYKVYGKDYELYSLQNGPADGKILVFDGKLLTCGSTTSIGGSFISFDIAKHILITNEEQLLSLNEGLKEISRGEGTKEERA